MLLWGKSQMVKRKKWWNESFLTISKKLKNVKKCMTGVIRSSPSAKEMEIEMMIRWKVIVR
jgi:hypothetical protein